MEEEKQEEQTTEPAQGEEATERADDGAWSGRRKQEEQTTEPGQEEVKQEEQTAESGQEEQITETVDDQAHLMIRRHRLQCRQEIHSI